MRDPKYVELDNIAKKASPQIEQQSPKTGRRIQSVELQGIVKSFPGVVANNNINLNIRAGEVLALLGENGAGKTTLMRILYGLDKPDAGNILINGEEKNFTSPSDSIQEGIGMIHQHFMLVSDMTVVENVVLGLSGPTPFSLDLDRASKRITDLSKKYGIRVNPSACIWQLSVGEQQRVEIIKALYRDADLLILDEPTSVLTPQEAEDLFITLRQMATVGHTIVFITHKLKEVMSIADRITVLRHGKVVESFLPDQTNVKQLARSMVGRDVLMHLERKECSPGDERLRLRGLCAYGDMGLQTLRDVNLSVHSGEIVGVAGVSGNGQCELLEVIAGVRRSSNGKVEIDGKDVTNWSPMKLRGVGISVIPEKRLSEATIPELTVNENFILKDHADPIYLKRLFFRMDVLKKRPAELSKRFDVRAASMDAPLRTLSGGNIQKLILARELSGDPRVLVAAQPTRGVDIGATEFIRSTLLQRRDQGMAILLISEDLDEILALSDRIAIMYEGKLVGIIPREEATLEQLGLLMVGSENDKEIP